METKLFPGVLRRLKSDGLVRSLISPIPISHQSFVLPLFLEENAKSPRPIQYMESVLVHTADSILNSIENALSQGIQKFLFFPIPAHQKAVPDHFEFAAKAIHAIRQKFQQDIWLASDLCLCSYTDHGHCGILSADGTRVLNQESVGILARYAHVLADAGADCIAPSDMMDGRIGAIRQTLDQNHHRDTMIMAYSAKFSSQWYGPFRDACHSSPAGSLLKDRKSYQLGYFDARQALRGIERDIQEGADIVMVKPSGLYTDILYQARQKYYHPLAAYQVSGEYASIEILAAQGMVDRAKAHIEHWAALHRSGADIIISYAAAHAKEWLNAYEY
jgi:porphobilinogen synthase